MRKIDLIATTNPMGAGKWKADKHGRRMAEPLRGKRVVLLPDNDAPGGEHVRRVAEVLRGIAKEIKILDLAKHLNLPERGDIVDALRNGLTRERIEALAAEATPLSTETLEDGRPEIKKRDDDLGVIIDETWAAIETYNHPRPRVFRFGGAACVLGQDESGDPTIRSLMAASMREVLARAARWYRVVKSTDPNTGDVEFVRRNTKPPADVGSSMLASDCARLPALLRILRAPIVSPSGRVVSAEGYDAETRTYYVPRGLTVPPVSDHPTDEEIRTAVEVLLVELLGDFSLVGEADQANALGMFLLPFARELLADHPTPLHLIEKPSPGSGASLMVEALGLILLGSPPAFLTEGKDEDEWRKRITSTLREGPALVVIDNLRRRLDSAALSSVLTARVWTDRDLGVSRNITVPVRCVWIATGNNPAVSSEIARRAVSIRIDPKVDRPWDRKPETFRHPKLLQWARENRPRLIHALLTLIRAWISRGRPRGKASLGSYEEWAATIGGILDVAAVSGFLANSDRFYSRADRETEAWRALIAAWSQKYRTSAVGVKDLFALLEDGEIPFDLGRGGERSQRTRLGEALRTAMDRRFTIDGQILLIAGAGKRSRAALYQLVEVESQPVAAEKGSPGSPGSPPHACEPGEPHEPCATPSGEAQAWDL